VSAGCFFAAGAGYGLWSCGLGPRDCAICRTSDTLTFLLAFAEIRECLQRWLMAVRLAVPAM
jgi:hypothetical protein